MVAAYGGIGMKTTPAVLTAICLLSVSIGYADVALPGTGGGDAPPTTNPPASTPPTPDLSQPQTGDRVDNVIGGLPDNVLPLEERAVIEAQAGRVDERIGSYRPGAGANLRREMDSLAASLAQTRAAASASGEDTAEIDALIEDVQLARRVVEQVDASVNNANRNLGVDVSLEQLTMLRRFVGGRRGPMAGPALEALQLSLEVSYASFTDDAAGGSGDDSEGALYVTGDFGSRLQLAVGATHNYYELGVLDLERQTRSLDFFVNYSILEWLAVGCFLNYSQTDIESNQIQLPGIGGTVDLGDQFDRWAGGISASLSHRIKNCELGLTTSLSSSNKQGFEDLFESKDTAFATLADVHTQWTDRFATNVFATFYTLVQDEEDVETSFWLVGTDLSFSPNDRWTFSVGYEATLEYTDYEENRVNASVSYTW